MGKLIGYISLLLSLCALLWLASCRSTSSGQTEISLENTDKEVSAVSEAVTEVEISSENTDNESSVMSEAVTEAEINAESTDEESSIVSETITEAETTIDPLEIYDWYWWDPHHNAIYADRAPHIDQVDEFKAFCQYPPIQEILPPNFLGYDQLSSLGCFDTLYINGDNGYTCHFIFYDEGDQYSEGKFTFKIGIDYLSNEDSHDVRDLIGGAGGDRVTEESGTIDDMTTSILEYHNIVYHNIVYYYGAGGELRHMYVIIDDYWITIGIKEPTTEEMVPDSFKDYAPAEPNFITLLLEGAEYEEVANSFRKMIATADE